MAQARKAAAKRGAKRKTAKKAGKKVARKAVKKTAAAKRTGKATKKSVKKTVKKAAKKTGKKTAKKSARKTAKTSRVAKAARRAPARKTVRKSPRKAARKAARKTVRKTVQAPRPSNPVVWFEIPVRDMQRAQAFYEHALQVKLSPQDMGTFKMAWFPGGPDGSGATGTLMQSEGYTPSLAGSLVYLSVKDIEATLARVQQRGGRVLNPKMSIGEFGFVGHFEDCEGNRVALHSMA